MGFPKNKARIKDDKPRVKPKVNPFLPTVALPKIFDTSPSGDTIPAYGQEKDTGVGYDPVLEKATGRDTSLGFEGVAKIQGFNAPNPPPPPPEEVGTGQRIINNFFPPPAENKLPQEDLFDNLITPETQNSIKETVSGVVGKLKEGIILNSTTPSGTPLGWLKILNGITQTAFLPVSLTNSILKQSPYTNGINNAINSPFIAVDELYSLLQEGTDKAYEKLTGEKVDKDNPVYKELDELGRTGAQLVIGGKVLHKAGEYINSKAFPNNFKPLFEKLNVDWSPPKEFENIREEAIFDITRRAAIKKEKVTLTTEMIDKRVNELMEEKGINYLKVPKIYQFVKIPNAAQTMKNIEGFKNTPKQTGELPPPPPESPKLLDTGTDFIVNEKGGIEEVRKTEQLTKKQQEDSEFYKIKILKIQQKELAGKKLASKERELLAQIRFLPKEEVKAPPPPEPKLLGEGFDFRVNEKGETIDVAKENLNLEKERKEKAAIDEAVRKDIAGEQLSPEDQALVDKVRTKQEATAKVVEELTKKAEDNKKKIKNAKKQKVYKRPIDVYDTELEQLDKKLEEATTKKQVEDLDKEYKEVETKKKAWEKRAEDLNPEKETSETKTETKSTKKKKSKEELSIGEVTPDWIAELRKKREEQMKGEEKSSVQFPGYDKGKTPLSEVFEEEPKPKKSPKETKSSNSTIERLREEAKAEYEEAKKNLNKKLNRLNAGVPLDAIPEVLKIAKYHGGTFFEWSKAMLKDIGERVKPYLKHIWDEITRDRLPGAVQQGIKLPAPQDITKAVQDWAQKTFVNRGNMPREAYNSSVYTLGRIQGHLSQMRGNIADLKYIANKSEALLIDDYLHDPKNVRLIQSIRPEVRAVANVMRDHIDAMTDELIANGIVEANGAKILNQNKGTYLTRSYEAHDNPKYKPTDNVRQAAVNFIFNQYNAKGFPINMEQANGLVKHLLIDKKAPESIVKGGKFGSMNLGILKKKDVNLPEEIRNLLGEYHDPVVNYAKTIMKQADLLEKAKFLQEVKKEGLGKYFFEGKQPPDDVHFAQFSAEGYKPLEPLSGLWTTPEIKKAFEEYYDTPAVGTVLRHYSRINGLVKYSKTALSPTTSLRNFIANFPMVYANGYWNPKYFKESVDALSAYFGISRSPIDRAKIKRYLDLAIVQQSPIRGELIDMIKDADLNKSNPDKWLDETFQGHTSKLAELPGKVYGALDDFFKIYAFENELADQKRIHPKDPIEVNEKRAAEIIRNVLPSYSMVSKGVKAMRRFPGTGTFVSFPAEIVRTSFHGLDYASKEIKSSNPIEKMKGFKRAFGWMSAYAATATISQLSKFKQNVSINDERDLRKFFADWNKNSELFYLKKEKGKYTFLDVSNTDPYNYLKKGLVAALMGKNVGDALLSSMVELAAPFLSPELLAGRLRDISSNTKASTGGEIWFRSDTNWNAFKKATAYLWEGIQPGGVTSALRIHKALTGQTAEYGKKYDFGTELTNLFTGQRITTLDIAQGLRFKTSKFKEDMQDQREKYTRTLTRSGVSKGELDQAYEESNANQRRIWEKFSDLVHSAIRLGVSEAETKKVLEDFKVSKYIIQSIYANEYPNAEKTHTGEYEHSGGRELTPEQKKRIQERDKQYKK